MDFWAFHFPVSGVTTSLLLPPAVAFVISFFAAMGGVSGAFLILPFQMSVLHFISPSVSATNFVFNIVAIPSGVYRYIKEGRMLWPLTWTIILGTLPGILIGYYLRIYLLPDPRTFKFFVGCVLVYIAARLFYEVARGPRNFAKTAQGANPGTLTPLEKAVNSCRRFTSLFRDGGTRLPAVTVREQSSLTEFTVRNVKLSWLTTAYDFQGRTYTYGTWAMLILSFIVGIIGGTYGVGGGAIIAPFCVAVFHLPVYTVAGASLMGTFLSSIFGVTFYSLLPGPAGISTAPDWLLGCLFGVGGFAGIYLGAGLQKRIPDRFIKAMLGAATLFVSLRYILQFFAR